MWPGPGGPVPVARSPVARSRPVLLQPMARWPVARGLVPVPVPPSVLPRVWFWSRWPSPGPRPGPCAGLVLVAVARSRSRSRSRCRPRPFAADSILSAPGGRVAVPEKRITYAVWPASVSPGMDAQSLPGVWLFSKPLVRGKQYCEVGTIIRQKQEPNGCQSQLLDIKTLDVASLAAVFLERLCSRCCLPGVCFLEPF